MPDNTRVKENTLKPFQYPILISAFSISVMLVIVTSIVSLPRYVEAARLLKCADSTYEDHKLYSSIENYNKVLAIAPTSSKARFGLARSLFSTGTKEAVEPALSCLDGVKLSESEYESLKKVMPASCQSQFTVEN